LYNTDTPPLQIALAANRKKQPQTSSRMAPRAGSLALVAALLFVCSLTAEAVHSFNFSSCNGAMACLGAQKLQRISKRSGRSADSLAAELDRDDDLVGGASSTGSSRHA
jgi:hypothetical protein